MRTYHVWIGGQKASTQHLVRGEDSFTVRVAAAAHYSNTASRRLPVHVTEVVARRVDDRPEELAILSHLGFASYPVGKGRNE